MNQPSQAMLKLKMMKQSTGCLALGLASLLPVIGVCCAIVVFWLSSSAGRKEKLFWNPAKPHRIIGLVCATFGGLIWGAVDTLIIYRLLNPPPSY